MTSNFGIFPSNKSGLIAEESYIVVRNGTSFLRILGEEPKWTVMTATASEDYGRTRVYPDRTRLIAAALLLCRENGATPGVVADWQGREYVNIGTITRELGETEDEFHNGNNELFHRFFELFDKCEQMNFHDKNEMRMLYNMLSINEGGDEVYLGGGMRLTDDGTIHGS